jgi:hypothetical protein
MKPFGSVNLWEEMEHQQHEKINNGKMEKIWIIELISQLHDNLCIQTCFRHVLMSRNHVNYMMQLVEGPIKGENNKNMCDSRHFFNFFLFRRFTLFCLRKIHNPCPASLRRTFWWHLIRHCTFHLL